MENADNNQYSMLVNISQSIGELHGDIKNLEQKIVSTEARISESYDATVKRQDIIRDSLEAEINSLRGDVKTAKERIDELEKQVKTLQESPKTRLFELFEKFKGLLIAAILAALVGWCMSFMKDLTKAVRAPLPAPSVTIEKHIERED